jgi:hypothetical protein
MKRITWITFSLSIAACSSSSMTPPSPADYDDAAQTIAAQAATQSGGGVGGGEVLAMADSVSIALGRLPLGFLRADDGRIRGSRMGVDHTFTVTCTDAAGAALERCDRTTDSATVEVKLSGELAAPNLTASIDRAGSWTITGLQSATATFNGDSSFSLDTTLTSIFREGVTSTLTLDATASYDAITIATADRKITGGSASFDLQAHRTVTGTPMGSHDVDKSFEIHAELTFNGDQTATLVLDGRHTFTIDLETGRVRRDDPPR